MESQRLQQQPLLGACQGIATRQVERIPQQTTWDVQTNAGNRERTWLSFRQKISSSCECRSLISREMLQEQPPHTPRAPFPGQKLWEQGLTCNGKEMSIRRSDTSPQCPAVFTNHLRTEALRWKAWEFGMGAVETLRWIIKQNGILNCKRVI